MTGTVQAGFITTGCRGAENCDQQPQKVASELILGGGCGQKGQLEWDLLFTFQKP